MAVTIPPITRRDALKLLSLGGGAWILVACNAVEPTAAPATPVPATPQPTGVDESAHVAGLEQTQEAQLTALPEIRGLKDLPDDFMAGRLTPLDDFYVQNSNGTASLDPLQWRLSLNGMFDAPAEISLSELKRYPAFEGMRTLECIGNPVGGTLIGNTTWKGTSLAALLKEKGLQPGANYILFLSEDGYETSVPVALALDERSLLVYEMDDQALTISHGFPVRVLLPGVYGQKQPKWVVSIRAADRDKLGLWEKKGWSNEATIRVNSRIETPKLRQTLPAGVPFHLTGIALSDYSGIQSVEVSIDDGITWVPAELFPGPDNGVWTLWHWLWADPQPGKYVVIARAMDGNGVAQTASGTFGVLDNVFPNGSSLMHNLSITVV